MKETITNGYYAGNGSVIVNPNGGMTIWGTPVIAASWVTDDKVLIIDNNFCERVEVEGMAIEFSYENASNVQQNMVTARIECYEDINLMQPTSAKPLRQELYWSISGPRGADRAKCRGRFSTK